MGKLKIIPDDKDPKFLVLPIQNEEASEDYADELWAEQAVKEHQKEKHHEYKTLDDLKALMARRKKEEQKKD